jgi:hypothetical protein
VGRLTRGSRGGAARRRPHRVGGQAGRAACVAPWSSPRRRWR